MRRAFVVLVVAFCLAEIISALFHNVELVEIQAATGTFNVSPTPTPTSTFIPTPTPTHVPGGGGGSVGPSALELLVEDVLTLWEISSNGALMQDVDANSSDGMLALHIPQWTIALDADGLPLTNISVTFLSTFPDPPDGYSILCAFDFEPDGATFDPAFTVRINIDPDALPAGFTGSGLVVAWFNSATGAWEFIPVVYNPETQEVTFSISHFTIYAVLVPLATTPTPAATPTLTQTATPVATPTPVETTTPVVTATPVQTPAPSVQGGTSRTGLWVGLGLMLAAVVLLLLVVGRRRRKEKKQPQKKSATDSR